MALIKSISGIRGTIGGKVNESLTPIDVVKFTSAFGYWLKSKSDNKAFVIGRDARTTGEVISRLISATLQSLGFNVVDLGLSTTPTVEIAVPLEQAAGGIIITASHNPSQWNALKLLNHEGEFISANEGAEVLNLADNESMIFLEPKHFGSYRKDDTYIDKHIQMVLDLPLVDTQLIGEKNFRVAVDAVNSTGGIAIPRLLRALGVKTIEEIYCEPDGNFPHNPEPVPENLLHISNVLNKGNFDLGISVDPDVDRLVFINEDGSFFGEEYTLVAIADYVLKYKKGNTVSNLSSTRALQEITEKDGGEYQAAAVGEVNVVTRMKETNAVIGGEGNGGVIYPDLHYGRDALVGVALFLTHLAKFGRSISHLRASYPNYYISKNKIELDPDTDTDHVLEAIAKKYRDKPVNTIDGVKIEFDKEWVHLRKSNTEPIIRIYAESDTHATAEYLANKIIEDIREILTEKA